MSYASEDEAKLLADFVAAGHEPELDEEGKPDFMAYSDDFPEGFGGHNGLRCVKCYYTICEWCYTRYSHKVEGPCEP
jgi:hypothetical protein